MTGYNRYIVRSPEQSEAIPEESLASHLLKCLRKRLPRIGSRVWMADVVNGTSVRFADVEDQSKRVASVLNKLGFRRGNVLFYVTHETAQLYVVQLAVWRLGGTIRGCSQYEIPEEYVRQMRETRVKFVLVDAETAPKLRKAISLLQMFVRLISVGTIRVEGAINYADMMRDDGLACPDKVKVHPREDAVLITNTNVIRGPSKGVIHTHHTSVAMISISRNYLPDGSILVQLPNYTVENFIFSLHSLTSSVTVYNISKFKNEKYFDILIKCKPNSIILNPYLASWIAHSRELDDISLGFISKILITGWELDNSVAKKLAKKIPSANLLQIYGIPECLLVACTAVGTADTTSSGPFPLGGNEGENLTTLGKLLPNTKGKIVDINTGQTLSRGERGELLIQSPCVMKGYLRPGKEPLNPDIDHDGWFRTGDMGFFDIFGNIYILERLTFMFKYVEVNTKLMLPTVTWVSVSEIELVLQEHPAVLEAGVVGVAHPETSSAARAYIVLRPGRHMFSWEMQRYVAKILPSCKQLHGGVRFVKMLPVTRKGHLDREALQKMALRDSKHKKNLVISDE